MNVLYITNVPAPYRVDFFNILGKYCKLTVIYERVKADDRNVLWKSSKNNNYSEIYLNGREIGNENSFCFNVIKYLKGYDHIIIGGYSSFTSMLAICYLKMKKVPFILNADGGFLKYNENKLKYLIKNFFISKASYWLSTSQETTNYLEYYGAEEDKIFKYPFSSISKKSVIDRTLNKSDKKSIKNKLGIKEENMLLYVGQYIHRKGIDVLIRSFEKVDGNVALALVGDIPTEEYKTLIKKLKIKNIYFFPFCVDRELEKFYLAADLFVLPTREDIWGLVITEALAYGLPIITTDKCGAGLELIKNDNGYIVPSENKYKLTEAINELLSDKALQEKIAINNIELAKKYTIEKMANKHYEILKRVENRYEI